MQPENHFEKLRSLEGLRGIAALAVVIFHIILIFYPAIFYAGETDYPTLGAEKLAILNQIPVMGVLNGSFAVTVFFVLSGFVLSLKFFLDRKARTDGVLRRMALKRYIRLMLPAAASVLLAWILLSSGLHEYTKEIAQESSNSQWLAGLWTLTPNIFEALYQGVYGAFFGGVNTYNPVLWTIAVELVGSLIVFAMLFFLKDVRLRFVFYGAIYLALIGTWYGGFVLGLILADLYASGRLQKLSPQLVSVGLIFGLILAAYPSGGHIEGTVFETLIVGKRFGWIFYLTIAGFLTVLGVLRLAPLAKILSWKYISGLGKYTYAVYLTHMPIIFTVTTGIFVLLTAFTDMNYAPAVLISVIGTIPILAGVSVFFEKYIDAPSIRLSSRLADWAMGKSRD